MQKRGCPALDSTAQVQIPSKAKGQQIAEAEGGFTPVQTHVIEHFSNKGVAVKVVSQR